MSLDIFVITNAAALPSAGEWAKAIKHEGFDIDLDQSFDTKVSSGFRPCPSSDRGFEYTVGPLSDSDIEDFAFSPQQQNQVEKFDSMVGFNRLTGQGGACQSKPINTQIWKHNRTKSVTDINIEGHRYGFLQA